MAVWTEPALLAAEGDEHLVAAVGATDAKPKCRSPQRRNRRANSSMIGSQAVAAEV